MTRWDEQDLHTKGAQNEAEVLQLRGEKKVMEEMRVTSGAPWVSLAALPSDLSLAVSGQGKWRNRSWKSISRVRAEWNMEKRIDQI